MAPPEAAGEDIAMRRRRLRYRAWHRGTREMDLMLGPFVDAVADDLAEDEVTRLERLLAEEDADLLAWILGQAPVPPRVDGTLIARLVDFRRADSNP